MLQGWGMPPMLRDLLPHSMVLLAQRPAAHGEHWWHWLTTMAV